MKDTLESHLNTSGHFDKLGGTAVESSIVLMLYKSIGAFFIKGDSYDI